ncbi:5' exonuclease Apollo-like [Daphnia carinata]|uniref:5' exonuclease Apollo-like n=1 Tax=Daphnia carinata TaxID=120202 RepID=UPI00257BADEC|nr:5' exonuclease Apollo-like [Daphnia carinata]
MTNGKLLIGLPIAIDYWKLPRSDSKFKTFLYFLTHLHTDHTQGLTSTWTETIYTSSVNRDLAISMLNVKPELIEPLEIGVSHMLPLPAEHGTSGESKCISVTLIDANHIKGSVMYLFEGSFGRVLYTGDFRWCEAMMSDPVLKDLSESKGLNLLYVDNTFEFIGNEFPTRENCMTEVLQIMRKHPYHRIIFGCQTIGKEDVLLRAALERKEKVYVPETIFSIYRILKMPCDHFTTEQADSALWFEKMHKISQFNLKKKNADMPTIAIKLTASGLFYKSEKFKDDELIFTVSYSNHSSASELAKFLDFLQPAVVERIVSTHGNKSGCSSVIDSYVSKMKAAEMTDDVSSDSMEISIFAGPSFKSQVPDFFCSAVSRIQSPHAIAVMETENTALSEDMDVEVPLERFSILNAIEKPPLASEPENLNVMEKANELIASILSDLDQFHEDDNEDYIYSSAFIEKLMALNMVYEPVTGITSSFDASKKDPHI